MSDWRISSDHLEHHGILGQKWGVRNGPPYPLDEEDHSRSEEKAGYKKSISNREEPRKNRLEKKRR